MSLKEKKKEKSRFLTASGFSRKSTVLDSVAKYSSSISHIDNEGEA